MDKRAPYGGTIEKITLERITFAAQKAISRELIGQYAGDVEAEIRFGEHIGQELAMIIRMDILGKRLGKKTVKYTLNWKEGVKEAFFNWLGHIDKQDVGHGHFPWIGGRLREKWPVQYVVEEFDPIALYPLMPLPNGTTYCEYPVFRRDGSDNWY